GAKKHSGLAAEGGSRACPARPWPPEMASVASACPECTRRVVSRPRAAPLLLQPAEGRRILLEEGAGADVAPGGGHRRPAALAHDRALGGAAGCGRGGEAAAQGVA